ncbi:hypothetical protein LX36DRAFT_681500 [Colletotrichum falcatum]|nr:hypothetical protein LX36DRAFT_681500 [Colletotrichum falcatum]
MSSHKLGSSKNGNVKAPSKSREDIKIALLYALTLEANAVRELFDEYCRIDGSMWSRMESPRDTNAYSFGVIGGHPAVIVHMPGMGKGYGAMVATHPRNSLPGLGLALVVRICGGVPFYEKEMWYPEKFETRESSESVIGRPPPDLRSLINKLKGRRDRSWMHDMTGRRLQTLRTYWYKHNDTSGCDTCCMSDGGICDAALSSTSSELHCDKGKLRRVSVCVALSSSSSSSSVAPTVMKSGEDRDKIAREKGVIALEMEGAGVWNMLPCLVIKAVCDYADSYKNKKWQNYAAATAAAYTKAFLEQWHM